MSTLQKLYQIIRYIFYCLLVLLQQLYIDPDGEYAFRSLKDAFRYIETGDVNKCASKPQKRSIRELHTVERELHVSLYHISSRLIQSLLVLIDIELFLSILLSAWHCWIKYSGK